MDYGLALMGEVLILYCLKDIIAYIFLRMFPNESAFKTLIKCRNFRTHNETLMHNPKLDVPSIKKEQRQARLMLQKSLKNNI